MTTTDVPTLDFDHHSVRFAQSGPEIVSELHAAGPLVYTPALGGFWVVTSFEIAKTVLTDPVTFSSLKDEAGNGGVTIPTMGPRLIPAEIDPPDHTAIRRILAPMFSKSGIEKIRGHVEKIVDDALDAAIAKGEFDIADDIAWVIAPLTILDWLGLPFEHRTDFIKAVRKGLSTEAFSSDPGAALEALEETLPRIMDLIEDRRVNPRDDLTSAILHHDEAAAIGEEDLLWLFFTLLLGGIENTAALMTNALLYLAENPDVRQRIIEDDSLIPSATEEFLRFFSPGVSLARNVTKDVEIGGCLLRVGDRVLVLLPAANHDASAFDRPEILDIERPRNSHLAFGGGPHYCIGVWMARVEFHYLLRQVLIRMPDYTVDRSRGIRYEDAGTMNGWSCLPASTNL